MAAALVIRRVSYSPITQLAVTAARCSCLIAIFREIFVDVAASTTYATGGAVCS
jgi:hypothetical protein